MKTDKIKYEDIPIPLRSNATGLSKAIRECPVGQSFLFPMKGWGQAAHVSAYEKGMKVSVRGQGNGIFRIWRIS